MTENNIPLKNWNTYQEMHAQPSIWREWAQEIDDISAQIKIWVAQRNPKEIWFCGAGTSAFIGDSLAAYLGTNKQCLYRAISTTDFVAAPYNFPQPNHRILIVSFGRSGASSETIAMLDILDKHYLDADRLNITCDKTSPLAVRKHRGDAEQRSIILPSSTLDKGFAMTSSYSTMLLSALACFDNQAPLDIKDIFTQLADQSAKVLNKLPNILSDIIKNPPERCIFLGSGALKGTARESSLKILELTCGQTVTQWDSSLGFRHGPKAIVNQNTKIFVLVSSHPHTQKYDLDIAEEIKQQYGADKVITVGASADGVDVKLTDETCDQALARNDAWCSLLYILVAQTLCVHWSSALKLNIDNPFIGDGNLSRVVAGVTIYPYQGN